MTQSSSSATPSQQSFAALRHPGYRWYFVGSALAMMADSIEHVISYWIIYEKFQSAWLGGFAVISHWLPFLLFSILSGMLADRFDPRRIIQLGMGLFMLSSLGWGVLFLTDSLEVWHAVVLLTLHGFAGVFWAPAGQLLIHDIVGPAVLPSAVRLIATSRTLGLLLGPAVGSALLLTLGPQWGILLNVLIYLPLVLWLVRAPYGPKFRTGAEAVPPTPNRLSDIVDAARRIAANRTIVSMTLLAGAASMFVGNAYQAQMPAFAHDLVQGDASIQYGTLMSANAIGALLAGIILESRSLLQPRPKTAFGLVILWCVAIGGFAWTSYYPLAVALLVIAGFLDLSYNTMAQTLVQLSAPGPIRGRVIGLYNMSSLGLKTVSGVTVGLGGSLIGIHWSLALSAAVLMTTMMALATVALRPAVPIPAARD